MAGRPESILVGTTLRPGSDPVIRAGLELARATGARLALCHVHSVPGAYFAGSVGLAPVSPDLLEVEARIREQQLEGQLNRLGVDRTAFSEVVIVAGAPHRMLLQEVSRLEADLVVLGARESERPSVLGSTADRVLRQVTTPVWLVDGPHRVPPERVLAPVDLSPLSERCLGRGIALLEEVCPEPPAVEALFVLPGEEIQASRQFTAEQLERLALEEVDALVRRVGGPLAETWRRSVRIGDVRQQILSYFEAEPADLVVLGTHGRSGFERFLLGSVAADVAARLRASTLILPPADSPSS